ncbi:MAG: Sua5/YciO/YrdC/YwlC family protein [Candidatus Woesearchaeota archaeon]
MIILTKDEFLTSKKKFFKELENSIFIHPTDSSYRLGCNATKPELVEKLRNIKRNNIMPFTVIVPSKDWINTNFSLTKAQKKYVEKLGKRISIDGKEHSVTLILDLKNKDCVAKNVAPGSDSLGVKIPEHWFSDIVNELGFPIVSTSANIGGSDLIESSEDIPVEIKNSISLAIFEEKGSIYPITTFRPYGYKSL